MSTVDPISGHTYTLTLGLLCGKAKTCIRCHRGTLTVNSMDAMLMCWSGTDGVAVLRCKSRDVGVCTRRPPPVEVRCRCVALRCCANQLGIGRRCNKITVCCNDVTSRHDVTGTSIRNMPPNLTGQSNSLYSTHNSHPSVAIMKHWLGYNNDENRATTFWVA